MLNQPRKFSVLPICREYFSVNEGLVPNGDNRPTDHHLRTVYNWALRDSEKTSSGIRMASYVRIGLAAVVVAVAWWFGSSSLAEVVSTFVLAIAVVCTVNDWGTKAAFFAIYSCDQALHLHDANLEAIGTSIDAVASELALRRP
jgi:energy-converting hydrogenase Eha subunit C